MRYWKGLAFFSALASATAVTHKVDPELKYPDYHLLRHCPGYRVHHVRETQNGVQALLRLDGKPCNAYGKDVKELTLEVTYETGEFIRAYAPN